MINIKQTSKGIEDEVDRMSNGPSADDLLLLEIVLQSQFRATQVGVHKQTKSLQLSGKMSSDFKNNKWEGEITYGGPSEGIHNPVDYAEYERERDGNHDFLNFADELDSEYVSAIKAFLKG